MKQFLFLFIISCFIPASVSAGWQAKVVDIYDGDTLILSDDGRAKIIRLFGIDCPRKEQPFGLKAKDYTSKIASGKEIRIETIAKKRYQKCKVYVDDTCLNTQLLKSGYAWLDRHGSVDESWETFEANAMAAKKGLWSQKDPEPPWEFMNKKERDFPMRRCTTIKLGGKHKPGSVPRISRSYKSRTRMNRRRR